MSGLGLSEDFPPNIQAVLAVTEEGDSCAVCIELEALIQTRRSLGAAGCGMSPLDIALEYAAAGIAVIPCEPASKEPIWSLVPKDWAGPQARLSFRRRQESYAGPCEDHRMVDDKA